MSTPTRKGARLLVAGWIGDANRLRNAQKQSAHDHQSTTTTSSTNNQPKHASRTVQDCNEEEATGSSTVLGSGAHKHDQQLHLAGDHHRKQDQARESGNVNDTAFPRAGLQAAIRQPDTQQTLNPWFGVIREGEKFTEERGGKIHQNGNHTKKEKSAVKVKDAKEKTHPKAKDFRRERSCLKLHEQPQKTHPEKTKKLNHERDTKPKAAVLGARRDVHATNTAHATDDLDNASEWVEEETVRPRGHHPSNVMMTAAPPTAAIQSGALTFEKRAVLPAPRAGARGARSLISEEAAERRANGHQETSETRKQRVLQSIKARPGRRELRKLCREGKKVPFVAYMPADGEHLPVLRDEYMESLFISSTMSSSIVPPGE